MKSLIMIALFSCVLGGSLTPTMHNQAKQDESNLLSMYTTPEEVYSVARVYNDIGLSVNDTYKGSGIKVGIIEQSLPYNYSSEYYQNIIPVYGGSPYNNESWTHADQVASILVGPRGIASEATYVMAVKNQYMDFQACVNALVYDYHVDIITYSSGHRYFEGNYMYETSYFIDQIVRERGVLFVAAAGNSDQINYETSEALGMNVLAVGASNKNFEASSRINVPHIAEPDYDGVFESKPNILAPGEDLFGFRKVDPDFYDLELRQGHFHETGAMSGTSFSAPIVAGVAARLMQRFPELKGNPAKMISLLCNSAKKANNQTTNFDSTNGFGIVNYANAVRAASAMGAGTISPSDNYGKLIYNTEVTIPTNKEFVFTSFAYLNGLYNHNGTANYIVPNQLVFPKLNVYLYNPGLAQIGPVATGTILSNMTTLHYLNTTGYTTFRVRVTLNSNEHQTVNSVAAAFNSRVISDYADSLTMTNAYLDTPATFVYSIDTQSSNATNILYFYNYLCQVVLTKTVIGRNGNVTLSNSEWNQLIDLRGREFYASMVTIDVLSISMRNTTGFVFNEPETFSTCTQLTPKDWGFAEQYYFSESTTTKTVDGIGITTRRLRCGYIRDMYVTLSPRRKDAGTAYFEMIFDRVIYGAMFGVTMWRQGELIGGRTGDSAKVEVLTVNNEWVEMLDLLEDVYLPVSRRQVDRYEIYSQIRGIRFYATSNPTGSSNNGRICIDDIVLNTNSMNISTFYEPIVENRTFIA